MAGSNPKGPVESDLEQRVLGQHCVPAMMGKKPRESSSQAEVSCPGCNRSRSDIRRHSLDSHFDQIVSDLPDRV
jgi:hypothetical protein